MSTDTNLQPSRDHELRNLLFLIISFSQLLGGGQAGPVTAQQKEFLDHVVECARKMQPLLPGAGHAG